VIRKNVHLVVDRPYFDSLIESDQNTPNVGIHDSVDIMCIFVYSFLSFYWCHWIKGVAKWEARGPAPNPNVISDFRLNFS